MKLSKIQLITLLEGIVEFCKDGQQGYKNASDDIKDKILSKILLDYSTQRERFMYELKEIIEESGGYTELSGSLFGVLHRRWMDIRFGIAGSNVVSVLKECLRGEKAVISRYKEVLKNELPQNISTVLNKQLGEINGACMNIEHLLEISEDRVADVS